METSLERCGKCCAGNLCIFEHMQLRNCHKCACCKQVVHVLCGIGNNKDDSFICKLCYENSNEGGGLPEYEQHSIKHNQFSTMNTLPVKNNTATRNTVNKRYPNETSIEREVRLKRRRLQEAKRQAKVRKDETPEDADTRRLNIGTELKK